MSFVDHPENTFETYFDKLRRDLEFIDKRAGKYKSIKNKLTRIQKTLNQMEMYGKFKTDYLNNKLLAITTFLTYLNKVCDVNSTRIFGSFVRNLFERAFTHELDTTGYGDSQNHDVDMIIFNTSDIYEEHKDKFNSLIATLKVFGNLAEDTTCSISFNGYRVIRVDEKTMVDDDGIPGKTRLLDIPHYATYLKNEKDIIKIDILAYNVHDTIDWPGDYDVNGLYIDCDGVHCAKNENFMSVLLNISRRSAVCNINFETIVKKTNEGTRDDREIYLKQIVFYLNMRTKILEVGYENIYSLHKHLVYDIETKEDCPISGRAPPFIKIKMQCGDWISLMAFSGVVGIRGSDYTESICCPMCRSTLMPELISKTPPELVLPPIPKVTKSKTVLKLEDYKKSKILMSAENKSDVAQTYLGQSYGDSDVPPNISDAYGANPLIIGDRNRARGRRSRRSATANMTPVMLDQPIDSTVSDEDNSAAALWGVRESEEVAETGWETE
jgi:hypothetical protein